MNDQLSMFPEVISPDTSESISSPESPDGNLRSSGPDGKDQSGPDHAPVSRFRARDSEKDMPTNDTSGPLFMTSSPSADLQRCLENKLQARMDGSGSPLFDADLERLGYACGGADMPAAGVGAPHIRQRLVVGGQLRTRE